MSRGLLDEDPDLAEPQLQIALDVLLIVWSAGWSLDAGDDLPSATSPDRRFTSV